MDSNNTHGWLARVYRGEWVGSRSFADRQYGGSAAAESTAKTWARLADERLPIIPAKPWLRKASYHRREDARKTLTYFDVYLPFVHDNRWVTKKLYFRDADEIRQQNIAKNMVANQNMLLITAHKKAMEKWQREHDRIMQEILTMWPEVKAAL